MNKNLLHKIYSSIDLSSDEEKRKTLQALRNEIDRIDKIISKKLLDRTKIIFLIGKIKKKLGVFAYSSEREDEIIKNIKGVSDDLSIQISIENIYNKIIEESRSLQKTDLILSQLFEKNKLKDQKS